LANALLLAHAVRFNSDAVPNDVERIALALGADDGDAAGAIDQLRRRLGLPDGLGEVGVTDEDLDAVARLAESHPTIGSNPRPVTADDARAILEAAY
jgi:alcohol dehydrogenase class IV